MNNTMKFAILYNTEYYSETHGSPSSYYGQILDQAQLAEELGFDAVWFGEHHYSGYSFGSPAIMAMAAAHRTTTLKLGIGVSVVPLNHPIRLAEEYAMLDVLSEGRLEYGVGRGFLKYAYDLIGVDPEESHARYHEGTELIVRAWTSDAPFSFSGKFWKLDNYSFFPRPLQKPHPPIYACATGTPGNFIWAGTRGFHLSTCLFLPFPERTKANIELYRSALRQSGYDPAERDVAGLYQMYCGEDEKEARVHGQIYASRYLKFFGALDQRCPWHPPSGRGHLYGTFVPDWVKNLARISRGFDGQSHEFMIGDPETLIKRIRRANEYYGTNYLILEVAQGGVPHEYVIRSLERFAKYVMPAFTHSVQAISERL